MFAEYSVAAFAVVFASLGIAAVNRCKMVFLPLFSAFNNVFNRTLAGLAFFDIVFNSCDILDTISLKRLFQLRLQVQWDPYKRILAKSLNFGPNVRLFRARKCGFWSDPPPLLGLNHQLLCRFDWTAPQIRFLEFIDIFQSKSHPFYQSSKRPQIIRRGSIKSIWIQYMSLSHMQ